MMTENQMDILIVDDSPVKLLALETTLEPLGQRLHKASSGREALRLMLLHDFAVVLLDVHMPGMDGFETAELIRGRERSAHTPIIFVSAVSQSEAHASRGYSLGAVDYVFAPFIPEIIRAKVSVFVELHRKTLEAREMAAKIAADARELEASSQRLRHAERMSSLGTLAAGLGHDMGNLLMPIRFRIESIEGQQIPEAVRDDLAAIRDCAAYLQRLAHGLRMLALDGEDDTVAAEETELRRWWENFSHVLRSCLPQGVVLESSMQATLGRVRIAEHRLSQAVFNLVQNAGDALRGRPTGTVRVWTRDAGESRVRVGITDDGPGMSDEVKRRCLDPFFTTKTRIISTGLGLSLVQAMVNKSGGALELESRPGEGTTFSLLLQASAAPTGDQRTDDARPLAHVSVAEPRIGGFIGAILGSLGWQVRTEGDEPAAPPAQLWVTEADRTTPDALRRFGVACPAGRIVLLGPAAPEMLSGRVILAGDPSSPGGLRAALREAATCSRTTPHESKDRADADQSHVRGRQRVDRRSDRTPAPARR
jgi:signal transduction histidine kinase